MRVLSYSDYFNKIIIQQNVSEYVCDDDIPLINDILNIARDVNMSVDFEQSSITIRNDSYFENFDSVINDIISRLEQFEYFNRVSYETAPSLDTRLIPVKLVVIWREE